MTADTHDPAGLSPHRIEALTDGIYAVAMTLLVIDLKLPEHARIDDDAALLATLAALAPKLIAWLISFFVLASFWLGHHRAFNHLKRTDRRLIMLTIWQLAFVSLMPFSSSLVGEHQTLLVSQIVYSTNMAGLAAFALLTWRYLFAHPEMSAVPMTRGTYRGAIFRVLSLILVSIGAVAIATVFPSYGNAAFAFMAVVTRISRHLERNGDAAAIPPAAS